jgi:hypothetical protein
MSRNVSLSLLTLILIACNISAASKEAFIQIEEDHFRGDTEISIKPFVSRSGMFDKFPVTLSMRANYKSDALEFLQIYVIVTNTEWGFYFDAIAQDGFQFEVIDISKDTNAIPASSTVTTEEHLALNLTKDYLETMSSDDWKIKLYGKNREGVFTVPQATSKEFLRAINCFEDAECSLK